MIEIENIYDLIEPFSWQEPVPVIKWNTEVQTWIDENLWQAPSFSTNIELETGCLDINLRFWFDRDYILFKMFWL